MEPAFLANTVNPMSLAPVISCIIPVYNDKLRLPRAVKSALDQRPGVQVVLVDDCSSDGSRELTLEMARDDPRIVAFPLPRNCGQGYARNIGAVVADAPYITFLDQDDEHVPGWYDHALELLQADPGLAGVKGEIRLLELPPGLSIDRADPRWPALINSPLWNLVVRKVVYQALGGCPTSGVFRTREGVEDITLVTALTRHFRVGKTEHLATSHYVNPNGATAYYLRRTRVVGTRIEFLEATDAERGGTLDGAVLEFHARAAVSIKALRALLPAPSRGFSHFLARILLKLTGGKLDLTP
jgi:glycosyltransferase involved in cell wall biosynthesis